MSFVILDLIAGSDPLIFVAEETGLELWFSSCSRNLNDIKWIGLYNALVYKWENAEFMMQCNTEV